MFEKRQRGKRFLNALASLFVVFVFCFSLAPKTASAQGPTVVPITDQILLGQHATDKAAETVQGALVGSVTTALINIMTYFANNAAYDAAVLVASGGNAEEPLFEFRPWEDYLIYAGASVASEVINQLADERVENGELVDFNVCAPPNLPNLRIGIKGAFDRQDLEICGSIDELKSNWGGFIETARQNIVDPEVRNQTVLTELSNTFDPNVNDFTVSLGLYTDTLLAAETKGRFSLFDTLSNGRYKPVVDFITGQVETPASMVENYATGAQSNALDTPGYIVGNLLANSEALVQVGISAGSVFTNTLLSQLTQKLADGYFDLPNLDSNPFEDTATTSSSRASAIKALKSLQTFQTLDVTNFNLLSELASCPSTTRGTARRLYNCTIDTNFASVLGRAEAGNIMTLKQAVDEGIINGSWPLIPETDDARDQDPNCYTYGFCHGNIVKLRKARIVPIGWELATQLPEAAAGTLTLKQVMDGFNTCNAENQRDGSFPYCHLIDPNWVLKLPETSCRILANGQILEAAGVSTRAEECVDIQSCITEGDDGQCVGGFGYCVREKNVWRFRGDECPAYAASCLGFTSRTGEDGHFLTTTVDQSNCSADSAGCTWYATQKIVAADDTIDWPIIDDVAAAAADPDAFKNRIYLTGSVEECSQSEAGCTELVERNDVVLNALTNSSFEADADQDGFPDAWLSINYPAATIDDSGLESRTGAIAVSPGTTALLQPGVVVNTASFYTISFYAKQASAVATEDISVGLSLTDPDGVEANFGVTSYDTDNCVLVDTNGNGIRDAVAIVATPASDVFERFECAFTVPTFPSQSQIAQGGLSIVGVGGASGVIVDDVQVENETSASSWTDGYSTAVDTLPRTFLKLPPAYLGCDGGADDPVECADYARVCTENDAGCSLYSPTNGDPDISGIVSELDRCDAACSGYDTFKQEPTRYEPNGEFPVYFIASSADVCAAEDVGCDEFTNLNTEEKEYFTYLRACVTTTQAGTERGVFYTWEGSDVEGYQLRTWDLLDSNIASASTFVYPSGFEEVSFGTAPCTHWMADEDGITCVETLSDITAATDVEDCDEHDDIFDHPDCREFYDTAGNIHYRNWRDTATVNDSCVSYRKTDIAGLGDDLNGDSVDDGQANCSESGGYFNTASNACIYYGFSEESDTCDDSANGCREYTGGQGRNSRLVLDDNFEAGLTNWEALSALNVTLSNESIATDGHSLHSINSATVRTYVFDNGGECTDPAGCTSTTGVLGGSCIVLNGEQYCGTLENQLFQNKTYTLSFWAKGNGDIDVGFDFAGGGLAINAPFADDLALEGDWNEYNFGPLYMSEEDFADFGAGTTISFDADGATEFFIDNVVLREGEENITIIRDSWVTPAVCDENFEGIVSPQFQLGCQEYTDQNGAANYLKSFSRLCSEDLVGCTGYYDTANSDSVDAQVLNATCSTINGLTVATKTACHLLQSGGAYVTDSPNVCDIVPGESSCQFDLDYYGRAVGAGTGAVAHITYDADTAIVEHDHPVYAVFDDAHTCSGAGAGCEEVGKPTLSADQSTVTEWTSTFVINDPDSYDDILCRGEELFCEEWDGGDAGTWYFKNPMDRTCEYKTDVLVGGAQYDGFFRTGTSNFCYGTGACSDNAAITCSLDSDCATVDAGTCNITSGSYVISGTTSGVWRNGDVAYDGWVGTCTSENDGCSEFIDTLDFHDDEFYGQTDGESYFFIDNNVLNENTLLSTEKCNGQVSQEQGCALFYDTGETGLTYSASATTILSNHADELLGDAKFDLVDPVNCELPNTAITMPNGQTFDLCANRCTYRKSKLDSGFSRASETGNIPLGLYEIGGSCFTDADCPAYEADTGDLVEGNCTDTLEDPQGTFASVATPRLENDTNRVLKVNRDRMCSEWLTCADERTVWDPAIGAFRSVCSGIDLCQQASGDGSGTFCAAWDSEDPAVVLDVERYASRDVTWYGEEYSGYAVPDLYPLQHLSQVDVSAPMVCINDTDGVPTNTACEDESDCPSAIETCGSNPNRDYRLAFNAGECTESHGDTCQVGYCSENSLPCSSDTQCFPDGGSCIIGNCLDSNALSEDDCTGEDQVFSAGTCYDDVGDCGLDGVCGTGTCFESVAATDGKCFRNNCVVAMDGGEFKKGEEEQQVCRAYPESDSPFGNELVESWINASGTTETPASVGNIPYTVTSGFEQANFCAPGEDCICSYRKFDTESGKPAYVAIDRDDTTYTGICGGGSLIGALCNTDTDCDDTDGTDDGSMCKPLNRVDTIYGLQGFCLERDTAVNIQGDQDLGACITWLPIDELQGTTDLYAKFKNAGFFDDVYICSETRPFVTLRISDLDIDAGGADHGIACAESAGGVTKGNSFDRLTSDTDGCWDNVSCPDGYFGVVGQPTPGDYDGSIANQCRAQDNDCPYICVPKNSHHASSNFGNDPENPRLCLSPSQDDSVETSVTTTGNITTGGSSWGESESNGSAKVSDYGTPVYYWAANDGDVPNNGNGANDVGEEFLKAFNDVLEGYRDCVLSGVDVDDTDVIWEFPSHSDSSKQSCERQGNSGAVTAYRCAFMNVDVWPGCSEVSKVVDSDGEGYVWTNRINFGYTLTQLPDALKYAETTPGVPFGSTLLTPEDAETSSPAVPIRIGACTTGNSNSNVQFDNSGLSTGDYLDDADDQAFKNDLEPPVGPGPAFSSCAGGFEAFVSPTTLYEGGEGHNPVSPEARTFIDFFWNGDDVRWNGSTLVDGWTTNGEDKADVWARVTQMFARVDLPTNHNDLNTWEYDGANGWKQDGANFRYESSDFEDTYPRDTELGTVWDVRGTQGHAPNVAGIDPDKCFGSQCEEGPQDTITVGNQNSGDIQGIDGFLRTSLNFFAFANKEQLPIRRVIIDWGDEVVTGSQSPDNFFKNHRGLKANSNTESLCDDGDEWGKTVDSCDPNFFAYAHNYTCSETLAGGSNTTWPDCSFDADGNLVESPCKTGTQCAYQPRVHVRDNWGWCTGTCTLGDEGDDGCFENGEDTLNNPASTLDEAECAYQNFPSATDPENDPWVYYDGVIYVSP